MSDKPNETCTCRGRGDKLCEGCTNRQIRLSDPCHALRAENETLTDQLASEVKASIAAFTLYQEQLEQNERLRALKEEVADIIRMEAWGSHMPLERWRQLKRVYDACQT